MHVRIDGTSMKQFKPYNLQDKLVLNLVPTIEEKNCGHDGTWKKDNIKKGSGTESKLGQ